ncbi:uncharacterized protein A4U43_C05F5990 [Asparagus officinalis]|uniref:Plastocyanin-like domain-containing protein n=1 Tax=Asparagus officinalis TaxID=4686 RepID=A0A5P1EPQ6_ASPOF|nr:uncharacterized protein A4U43_C05F5990 [Asparagus officinalis]
MDQQRRTREDGGPGHQLPIRPANFTYHFQVKTRSAATYYHPRCRRPPAASRLRINTPLIPSVADRRDYPPNRMVTRASTTPPPHPREAAAIAALWFLNRTEVAGRPPRTDSPFSHMEAADHANRSQLGIRLADKLPSRPQAALVENGRSTRADRITPSNVHCMIPPRHTPADQTRQNYDTCRRRTRSQSTSLDRTGVSGKKIYALNGISHVDTATPLKLLEYFGLAGKEFKYDLMKDEPAAADGGPITARAPNVLRAEHRTYIEIIIENAERSPNFFHLDGYSFFTVGMGGGTWSPDKRSGYNLLDAVSRHTIQVYPKSWTAIMTTFDNVGVWNFRSEIWERRYLGQQMYISVLNEARSVRDEYTMQNTTALCGAVVGLPTPAPYT